MAKEGEASYATNHALEVLTDDTNLHCETEYQSQKILAKRLFWVTEELLHVEEKLDSLHKDLGAEGTLHPDLSTLNSDLSKGGGLPVAVASLPELTTGTKAIGKVEVSNPTSYTGLESTVSEGTETANQNAWAIFGMIVGFGLLMLLWRLLRP